MENIPIDPAPFLPRCFEIMQVEGRVGLRRVVVPHRQCLYEQYAIASIEPLPPGPVPFLNIRDVLLDFIHNEARVGFGEIQNCPFGFAYVQFTHVSDSDRLIRESLIAFQDVHVLFVKHNEGIN